MKRLGILVASAVLVLGTAPAAMATEKPAMLSSWQPVFSDQSPVGGHQELTVINHTDAAMDAVIVEVGPAPCECVAVIVTASHGSRVGNIWVVGTLQAGETATLLLDYEAPQVVAAEASSAGLAEPALGLSAFQRSFGLAAIGSFVIA